MEKIHRWIHKMRKPGFQMAEISKFTNWQISKNNIKEIEIAEEKRIGFIYRYKFLS